MALLVLDTNVWLDLLVFRDRRLSALHEALLTGVACAVTNVETRDELERVLAYPGLALDAPARADVVGTAARCSMCADTATPLGPLPRCSDADDQMFIDLAVATGASALLTRDDALLRTAGRLRRLGVEVMTPGDWCARAAAAAGAGGS